MKRYRVSLTVEERVLRLETRLELSPLCFKVVRICQLFGSMVFVEYVCSKLETSND